MSFVAFNVLTVPEENRDELVRRFAARAGAVDQMDGFEHFELLTPLEGTDKVLVYTRWESQEHFEAWVNSPAFGRGHRGDSAEQSDSAGHPGGHPHGGGEAPKPAATGSELWTFTVVQNSDAS